MSLNFYELYNILNEYGQNLINDLIEKFQKEEPSLTPNIIKNYIETFEKIKNNLEEKDITKYSWKELENIVDGRRPKTRIKAGKLDPSITDANLLYNSNKVRIYVGKDKKSCIRYSDGYNFCIGARGEENMYGHYRVHQKGTPYFIFNDSLSREDKNHLLVLIVYENFNNFTKYRYSLTNAENSGDDKNYEKLSEIIRDYPWVSPMMNFVDDDLKGTIKVDPIEVIEMVFKNSLDTAKRGIERNFDKNSSYSKYYQPRDLGGLFLSIKSLLFDSPVNLINDFVNEKNEQKIAYYRIYRFEEEGEHARHGNFTLKDIRKGADFCKNSNELIRRIKQIIKNMIEYDTGDFNKIMQNIDKNKEALYEILRENKILKDDKTYTWKGWAHGKFLPDNKKWFSSGSHRIDDALLIPGHHDASTQYFVIQVNDARDEALKIIEENKEEVDELNKVKLKFNKYLQAARGLSQTQQEDFLEKVKEFSKQNKIPITHWNFPSKIILDISEKFFG